MNEWYTVYGAMTPTPSIFKTEIEAIEYAKKNVSDWTKDISVIKSTIIWSSNVS